MAQIQRLFHPLGGVHQAGEVVVLEDGYCGWNGGGHSFYRHFFQCSQGAPSGDFAVGSPADQLANEVVIERRHLVACLVAGVKTSAVAIGQAKRTDRARRRQKSPASRVFGIDAHFNGMASGPHIRLSERKRLASGDADLLGYEVYVEHHLGHGVLHLQSGVHLQIVELPVFVEKLHRAGVAIAAAQSHCYGSLAHRFQNLRLNAWRRGFFYELLVAALRRAVAGAQMHAVAVSVCQNLHFHMARGFEITLQIQLVAPERRQRLTSGRSYGSVNVFPFVDDFHASAAAAESRFHRHWIAVLFGERLNLRSFGDRVGHAGHAVHAHFLGCLASGDLVAHYRDGIWRRADEYRALAGDGFGEIAVFAQKAVAGMHAVGPALRDGIQDGIGAEIALCRSLAAEGVSFVRQAHMQGVAVELGIDRHCGDAEFFAGANHPYCYLSAIGDEYFFHGAVFIVLMLVCIDLWTSAVLRFQIRRLNYPTAN